MFDSDDILHLVGCGKWYQYLYFIPTLLFWQFFGFIIVLLKPYHMVKKDVTLDSSWFSHLKFIIDILRYLYSLKQQLQNRYSLLCCDIDGQTSLVLQSMSSIYLPSQAVSQVTTYSTGVHNPWDNIKYHLVRMRGLIIMTALLTSYVSDTHYS